MRNILLEVTKIKCLFKHVHIKHPLKQLRKNLILQTGRDFRMSQLQTTAQLWFQTRLFTALYNWVLKTSKHEDCMTSLANPLHCFTVFMVKKFLLYPVGASHFSLCPLSPIFLPHTSEKLGFILSLTFL